MHIKYLLLSAALFCGVVTRDLSALEIESSDYKNSQEIGELFVFNQFGCTGQNRSPFITWKNPPPGTKSFAVTIYDPDAPTGSGWWHWVVVNIPPNVTQIERGAGDESGAKLPQGSLQTRTDYGSNSYGGPCPPPGHGPHRYILTVYALKTEKIDITKDASGALAGYFIQQNAIAQDKIVAKFERKKS